MSDRVGAPANAGGPRARVTVVGDAHVEVHRDAHGSIEFVGGRGVDTAIGLAVLGEEATLVATVGDDEDGTRIRAVLRDYGVRLVAVAAGGLPVDEVMRRAVVDADLVVLSGSPFADDARLDELIEAVERTGARFIVDGAASPWMPRGRTVDSPAAVAHLLAQGDPPASSEAWDDALEAALAALAAAPWPGRGAGTRSPHAPTDRGS